ncbi:hypothetical protein ASZ90_015892 [hydrocarbon metagenome]|uniref:Uncharacterized protein n=1 Tax=hydrocarbon metagenome TaxID=938273 RepID=A0A0W8F0Q2_9ZZZZ
MLPIKIVRAEPGESAGYQGYGGNRTGKDDRISRRIRIPVYRVS